MSVLVLAVAMALQAGSRPAAQARPEIAAAVQRGVAAYNAQDLAASAPHPSRQGR